MYFIIAGLLILSTINILGWIICCGVGGWVGEGCLELLIFSSIFGLYPLDASIISLLVVVITNSSAAAAKSLQSYLTLCDPIDGSPPGSPIPGILQARVLEWVAIAFSVLMLSYLYKNFLCLGYNFLY